MGDCDSTIKNHYRAGTISVVLLKANISDVRKLLGCVRAIDLTLLL